MNRSGSAIEAIAPAMRHVKTVLFRPFDLGRWFTLGFLTFLQLLGEGGGYNVNIPGRWGDREDVLRETANWIAEHWTLIAILGFCGILVGLILVVLFKWLSSRATFCYIDSIARNRPEVLRPWREYRQLADSFFFFRLVVSLCLLFLFVIVLVPIVISIWDLVRSGEDLSFWRALFGGGVVTVCVLLLVLLAIVTALLRVILVDLVTPVQYIHRIRCLEAFRRVLRLIQANLGAFVLYVLIKIVIAIVVGFGIVVLGCSTCCLLFCCMMIPVIGQTVLQPLYVFNRSFSLFFLQGFGPEFDAFGSAVPTGPPAAPAGGAAAAWPEGAAPYAPPADPGAATAPPYGDQPRPPDPGAEGG